jgi:uncharacterized damage-inducible protein DinB
VQPLVDADDAARQEREREQQAREGVSLRDGHENPGKKERHDRVLSLGCLDLPARVARPRADTAINRAHLNGMDTPTTTPTTPPTTIPLKSPLMPAFALAEHLDAFAEVVERLGDLDYLARPSTGVSGSIGAHVRHCVDHVVALLDRTAEGEMTYDDRRRDTAIEQSRRLAATTLRSLAVRVREMAPRTGDVPITLWTMLDRRGTRARVRTSLGRELVFVLQHTIHHEAVVAVLLAGRGRVLPGHFGLAPSTPSTPRNRNDARSVEPEERLLPIAG